MPGFFLGTVKGEWRTKQIPCSYEVQLVGRTDHIEVKTHITVSVSGKCNELET